MSTPIRKVFSGCCSSSARRLGQRNNLCSLSFRDGNSHGAAAAVAKPKILALVPISATVIIDFNLRYEQLAVAET